MKRLLSQALLAALCASVALASSTRISDTLYNTGTSTPPPKFSGSLTISWPPFTDSAGVVHPRGQLQYQVKQGVLDLYLVANAGSTPAGTSYSVTYSLTGGLPLTETWVVPVSATPVNLATVRTNPPPVVTYSTLPTTLLTGTLQAAQEPAHTGDVTNSAGSLQLNIQPGKVLETMFGFTDLTTANATTSKHGLLPRLSGNNTECFVGDGTFISCPGGGGGGGNYQTMQGNGSDKTQRPKLNFSSDFSLTDSSSPPRTDVGVVALTAITGAVDFSGSTSLKMRIAAGLTAVTNGLIGYDSTNNMIHAAQSSGDAFIPQFTSLPANNDCAKWVVSGSNYKLGTAGAACGGGGGGGTGNAATVQTITFSATPALVCPSATAGTVVTFELSTALTSNITPSISSCTPGSVVAIRLTQDAPGGRTVTWPSGWTSMCQPSPIPSIESTIIAVWDGTSAKGTCSADGGPSVEPEIAAPSGSPPSGYQFPWADSTGHFPRWKNPSGTIFQAAKELSSGNIRVAGGANTVDRAAVIGDLTGLGATQTIASGAKTLNTTAVSSAACSAEQTDTATGVATTDAVTVSFNGDPSAITGFVPLTAGGLTIYAYPKSNAIGFRYCNFTSSSITPGVLVLNWKVFR